MLKKITVYSVQKDEYTSKEFTTRNAAYKHAEQKGFEKWDLLTEIKISR